MPQGFKFMPQGLNKMSALEMTRNFEKNFSGKHNKRDEQ